MKQKSSVLSLSLEQTVSALCIHFLRTTHTSYLQGAHSWVRKTLGITMDGEQTSTFIPFLPSTRP